MESSRKGSFSRASESIFHNSISEVWDFLDVLLVLTDRDGVIHFVNEKCIDVLGYSKDELIGKNFSFLVPAEGRDEYLKQCSILFKNATISESDFIEIERKDGDRRVFKTNSKYLKDDKGEKYLLSEIKGDTEKRKIEAGNNKNNKVDEVLCSSIDITEKKKAEHELLEVNQQIKTELDRFEKVLLATKDGVFDWDLKTQKVYYSDRWKTMLGYQPDDKLPDELDTWESRTLEKDLVKVHRLVDKMRDGEIDSFEIQFEMRHKNGYWIDILARSVAIRDEKQNLVRIVGTHTNVTKSKRDKILLKDQQERYEKLFSNMPLGIAIYKAIKGAEDFEFVAVNKEAEEITKVSQEELVGKTLLEKFPNMAKSPLVEALKRVYWESEAVYLPPFYYKDSQREGWRENHIYKLKTGEIVTLFKDVTSQKAYEHQIIQEKNKAEEANRLKTEFLNNMSHEVRTPMNGIIGFSEMLNKKGISEEKRNNYTKIIQNSSKQLLKIIEDILEISTLETRQEKLYETEFCLNDFLMELFSIFNLKSKELNLSLKINKPLKDDQVHIFTDESKLNKILSNLLENALKFTHEGFVELGYYIEASDLVLYVKDTGIGIAPDKHKIIFDRFAQEDKEMSIKKGGLGLGLSIASEKAYLLGGEIVLESEKGKGSTFYVRIPFKPAAKTSEASSGIGDVKSESSEKKTYTILVAEDEEVNYLFIEVLFEDEIEGDYNVIHARSGKEAIDLFEKSGKVDLILMDIKMPEMNGYEATKSLKSRFPELPVIAQTAYSSESDRELARNHGFDDFITKPIDKNRLKELLNKYLQVK